MKDAGIAQIDKVLITHFHTDHVGGVPELVKRVRVGEFLDHGVNREDSDITRKDSQPTSRLSAVPPGALFIRETPSMSRISVSRL